MFSYFCPFYATSATKPASPAKPQEPAKPASLEPKPAPKATNTLVYFTLGMAK